MRTAIAALFVLIAGSATASAQADPYRWCALYSGNGLGGASNCYFVTQQQCLATVSGVGGSCVPNPRSAVAPYGDQMAPRDARRPRG